MLYRRLADVASVIVIVHCIGSWPGSITTLMGCWLANGQLRPYWSADLYERA
jgi:hypothetical protein